MSEEATPWKPGDVIAGNYALQVELGRGAMGAVWQATQQNLGRDVALKLLLPEYAHKPGARARFEREARVASRLEHPHAVRIHDFGDDGGQLYIAMELLRGSSLRALVDDDLPVLALERAVEILRPVAEVLTAAHDIGLVHRDVKPENVFLERRPDSTRVVVVDFGLAFIEAGQGTGRMTAEGVTAGTPGYLPPEQVAGDPVGPPADVYAFGCLAYEMLAGRLPFLGTSMQLLTQHLFSAPVPPSELRRDVTIPRPLEDVVMRCLAKLPSERPSMEVVGGVLSLGGTPAGRERGRDATHLEGREARMLSTVRPAPGQATLVDVYAVPSGVEPSPLAVVGALDGDLVVGLGANGLLPYIVSDEQTIEGAHAIYAPGADLEALRPLVASGIPVLTDAEPTDMERVTGMLRADVADVVHRPVRAATLSKKVWRAIRRARRRER